MQKFLRLTKTNGEELLININHIESVFRQGDHTTVRSFSGGTHYTVTQTFPAIAAILMEDVLD
jgi:uncharacterized protein YlzI (FlbEa/FlbD family)